MFDKKAYYKEYYKRNKEKYLKRNQTNKGRYKHKKEYYKRYNKEYRLKNKDKLKEYLLKNKNRIQEVRKKWQRNNWDKYKQTDKYKARQKARYRTNKIFKKYNYKCVDCGCDDINKLQIHHLNYDVDTEPEDNCILLCGNCHKKRHL